jgi:hypothetical protein
MYRASLARIRIIANFDRFRYGVEAQVIENTKAGHGRDSVHSGVLNPLQW